MALHPHARLVGRANAMVRVHLREMIGEQVAEHTIDLRLLVFVEPGDSSDRVREVVLAKTARVLKRMMSAMEGAAIAMSDENEADVTSDQPP